MAAGSGRVDRDPGVRLAGLGDAGDADRAHGGLPGGLRARVGVRVEDGGPIMRVDENGWGIWNANVGIRNAKRSKPET